MSLLIKPYLCANKPGHEKCMEINVQKYLDDLFASVYTWKNSPERSWNI